MNLFNITHHQSFDSNITHEELSARLQLLTENLRLQHIEEPNRGVIKKIGTVYYDIFTLPGNALPSTSLASHKIVLKEDKIINSRQPRHPECHREEVTNQVYELLTKKIIAKSDFLQLATVSGPKEARRNSFTEGTPCLLYF